MKCKVKSIISQRSSKFSQEVIIQQVIVSTGYGDNVIERYGKTEIQVGDVIDVTIRSVITRFVDRLAELGIEVKLDGNYPWVYLTEVNGIRVTERFQACHGFTAFFTRKGPHTVFSDRRKVFKKIREVLDNNQ